MKNCTAKQKSSGRVPSGTRPDNWIKYGSIYRCILEINMSLTDIHIHALFGVDDGAKTEEEMNAIIEKI